MAGEKEQEERLLKFFNSLEKELLTKLTTRLVTVMVISVGICFTVITWLFDYRFDIISDRFERVESTIYVSSSELVLKELDNIKQSLDEKNKSEFGNKDTKKKKR